MHASWRYLALPGSAAHPNCLQRQQARLKHTTAGAQRMHRRRGTEHASQCITVHHSVCITAAGAQWMNHRSRGTMHAQNGRMPNAVQHQQALLSSAAHSIARQLVSWVCSMCTPCRRALAHTHTHTHTHTHIHTHIHTHTRRHHDAPWLPCAENLSYPGNLSRITTTRGRGNPPGRRLSCRGGRSCLMWGRRRGFRRLRRRLMCCWLRRFQ